MSLVKKPDKTEKKVAANRQNQKLCHPVADEGRERIRTALLRFGFNAQAEEIAMRALGEDPAHFQELLEVLWEEWNPAGGLQEGVVIRLARAMWLTNRADRMQEGYAVRQAQDVSVGRDDRRHVQMMRLKMTANGLRVLAQSVAREDYFTPREDLETMKNLQQQGMVKEMAEMALALFCQLQKPGTDEDGVDPEEKARRVIADVRGIFGLSTDEEYFEKKRKEALIQHRDSQPVRSQIQCESDHRTPGIGNPDTSGQAAGTTEEEEEPETMSPEEEVRERARQLLENILTRRAEICEAKRKVLLKESVKGLSPYERAAEIAPTHPDARLMRRMQDSNFREVRRVTNLLLKLKRHQRQMEAPEETAVSKVAGSLQYQMAAPR